MYKRLPIVYKSLEKLNKNIPSNTIGIHGILYDVSNINHPGGHVFIHTALGTDASSLFETHHLDSNKANLLLEKLPIVGYYKEYNKYEYSSYKILKTEKLKKFPTRSLRRMQPTQSFKLYVFIFMTLTVHFRLVSNTNIYTMIPYCLLSSYLNAICGGYGHNAVHQLHPVSVLLDWNGLSCYEWLLEHIQSHHMNVNTELDNDSISMEPFLFWLPKRKKNHQKFTLLMKHIVFLISELVVAFNGFFVHRARWSIFRDYNFPVWMRMAPCLFLLRFLSHIAFSGNCGLFTFFITLCCSSYLFSYLAHLNHTYENDARPDFLLHQLKNTKNINSFLKGEFILFLDRQVEHHLFPSIDQTVLEQNKEYSYSLKELNHLLNETIK